MSINRITQRLNSEKSKNSVDTDTFLNVNLESKQILLPPGVIDKVLNVNDRFNYERQNSKYYRILGTINPVISNCLFNLTDNTHNDIQTLAYFNNKVFLDTTLSKNNVSLDLTYAESIKTYLKEVDGWFGYINPIKSGKTFCSFIDMEPKRQRFSFVPDTNSYNSSLGSTIQQVKNWELTITYPKDTDKKHEMVIGGLLIINAVPVIVAERNMVAFGMACLHNLNIEDTVIITGTNGYDGTHTVVRTGLDNGDYKDYYFVIDLEPTGSISNNSRMKRIVEGQESEYYFRLFNKINTRNGNIIEEDDYETYKLAFSENIYTDDITQFVFNEDIDITGLVDNLGRPLSELYLTVLKTDSDGLFTNVSSGIETPFLPILNAGDTIPFIRNVPAINKIHNGGSLPFISHKPLENNIKIADNHFYGDLVEYNKIEAQEIILADVKHRFNTINRESANAISNGYVSAIGNYRKALQPTKAQLDLGPRQEGYLYSPHFLIKIRQYSSYVEQGDNMTEGMPDYKEDLGDGRYLWRDMLDIGFNESDVKALDYPFLNGCHYMYQNYCFSVRRQDPFNIWKLFYTKFPSDIIGGLTSDKFTVNSEDNAC